MIKPIRFHGLNIPANFYAPTTLNAIFAVSRDTWIFFVYDDVRPVILNKINFVGQCRLPSPWDKPELVNIKLLSQALELAIPVSFALGAFSRVVRPKKFEIDSSRFVCFFAFGYNLQTLANFRSARRNQTFCLIGFHQAHPACPFGWQKIRMRAKSRHANAIFFADGKNSFVRIAIV
jgi:hypothetical protein